jgi:hypothetical protein
VTDPIEATPPAWTLRESLLALAAYALIPVAATWPLAAHLGSQMGGEIADPWQTLWGFWWWRHSASFGGSPMFSPLLWAPGGVPLWLQTWDVPSTLAVWPLWGHLPAIALYNLPLIATFPLAGFTFCLLCRELWGGRLGPFLAGCLYTFSTFHFAHARMQLHLSSLEWSPLFFLFVTRTARTGRWRDAALAGVALALAAMASTYHLIFCVLGAFVLLAWGTFGEWPTLRSRFVLRNLCIVTGVFLGLAGWLLLGMIRSSGAEPYVGGHDAARFSADVQSFFVPNGVSLWSRWLPVSTHWTGNEFESAAYVGYLALGLALLAGRQHQRARGYLVLAAVGAVLALGPLPHIGGSILPGPLLPEASLELFVPFFRMSGMPTRFSWLTMFGVAVAAGAALSGIAARGRRGALLAIALTCAALIEVWPKPFVLTSWPEPPIFAAWAADPDRWTVLDATPWSEGLWHQMAHHHPLVTGYVTRTPARLWDGVHDEPALRPFLTAQFGSPAAQTASPASALRVFRRFGIRFVIVADGQADLARVLNFSERYRGSGIRIFEVPPPPP